MNTKLFSEAMSEVNDKYYEEAANYHCKKHGWVKFTSLAACAAIVLAVSFQTRIISRTILSKVLVLTSMKLRNSMPRVEVSLLWQMIIPQCLMKNCSDILMYHSQLQKRFPTLHSRAMILVFTKQIIVEFIMMGILLSSEILVERRT